MADEDDDCEPYEPYIYLSPEEALRYQRLKTQMMRAALDEIAKRGHQPNPRIIAARKNGSNV